MEVELKMSQRELLKAQLVALRSELEVAVGLVTAGAKPVDLEQPFGRLSRMDAMQQQSMAKAARRRHEQRLLMTLAALNRLDDGDYGDCRRCDDPIGFRRLRARPETPNCVACQAELEAR